MPQIRNGTLGFGATEFQFMMVNELIARSTDATASGFASFQPINIHYTATPIS